MDGVLVIDKPEGITSHDVVSAARRILGEKRIGHTGTLDPLATGVLPLACGRATRLVRFLTASDKDYEATIVFGVTTDTLDVMGEETSRSGAAPSRDVLIRALETFRGESMQVPPAYSAKKIAGRRAYEMARRNEPVELEPVRVRISRLDLLETTGDRCRLALTSSAGFYVRSLVRDLGERCGTGACLEALRRTRSGDFVIDEAIDLDSLGRVREAALQQAAATPGHSRDKARIANPDLETLLIPMEKLLPAFPAATVTAEGLSRVSHGQQVRPVDLAGPAPAPGAWVRLHDTDGALVALATPIPASGVLHPEVVLI
jgi:tRNA pseudouridine55 synthase